MRTMCQVWQIMSQEICLHRKSIQLGVESETG